MLKIRFLKTALLNKIKEVERNWVNHYMYLNIQPLSVLKHRTFQYTAEIHVCPRYCSFEKFAFGFFLARFPFHKQDFPVHGFARIIVVLA